MCPGQPLAYPERVNLPRFLLSSTLLRASVLALLMLGVAGKPMLASLCGVQAFGHQMAALAATNANPVLGSDHQHDAGSLERAHGSGSHQLLHEDDVVSVYADLVTVISIPSLAYQPVAPAPTVIRALPQRHLDSPFRPPIAA